VILLTGATGTVGSALLRRLTAAGHPVRCLVRDPRGLGSERVRVQIALGDLADPASFRNALRGVDTVVHLAASMRDQPRASIEELNGLVTLRLARAAERSGAERFVFFSAIGAALHSPSRFLRSKARAEEALRASPLQSTVLAPSIAYAPGDPWLRLLERLSYLPVVPLVGSGSASFQPIWAEDVADCAMAVIDRSSRERQDEGAPGRYELAGPDELTYEAMVTLALRSFGRPRRRLPVPPPLMSVALAALERTAGRAAPATRGEAELLSVAMTTDRGTADAERLGVRPRSVAEVLAPA